jgi:Xaa-Pro aminopeptidase
MGAAATRIEAAEVGASTMHTQRLQAVMHAASAAGAGAALLSDRASLRWLGADHARHLLVHDDLAVVAIALDDDAHAAAPPATAAAVERIDVSEREAVAAALARALARAGIGPLEPVAIESAQLPSALVRVLGADACRDIGGALAGMRARKDDAELAAVARAATLVDAGHAALRERLRAGRDELELWGEVRAAVVAAAGGGEPQTRVELSAGARTALAGMPPGRERVADGEPVVLALACEQDGWWASAAATLCCGTPDHELRRRHALVRDALRHGVEAVRPGATSGDVDRAMRSRLARAGLRCPSASGHAVGRSPHEAPTLRPGGTTRLTPGMALVLEPAAIGAGGGVRLAQTVVVTAGGAHPLTAFPPELA